MVTYEAIAATLDAEAAPESAAKKPSLLPMRVTPATTSADRRAVRCGRLEYRRSSRHTLSTGGPVFFFYLSFRFMALMREVAGCLGLAGPSSEAHDLSPASASTQPKLVLETALVLHSQ